MLRVINQNIISFQVVDTTYTFVIEKHLTVFSIEHSLGESSKEVSIATDTLVEVFQ
jgi:hypothetical protein